MTLNRLNQKRCICFALYIFFIFNSSCVKDKLDRRLAEHEINQLRVHQVLNDASYSSKYTQLEWDAATVKLLENNAQYRSALYADAEIKKSRKRLYTDLIPKVFAFLNISASLDELANISTDDIQLSIVSNLTIPNPIQFYAQLYAIALQEIQSKLNLELQRRQLITALYRNFIQFREIDLREKELSRLEQKVESSSLLKIPNELKKIRQLKRQIARGKETLRLSTNGLFDSPGGNWQLVGPIPKVSYAKKLDQVDFDKGYGQLGLKLQTLQIEASLAALWGAQIARYPNFSIGVSSPQIFNSSTPDDNFQFDAEDFGMFTGLSKSIRFDDIFDKEQLRRAEYRTEANAHQLAIQMEREISTLVTNKKVYRYALSEKKTLLAQRKQLLASNPRASAEVTIAQIENLKKIDDSIRQIDRTLLQLDLQFWIWDDKNWK